MTRPDDRIFDSKHWIKNLNYMPNVAYSRIAFNSLPNLPFYFEVGVS
jgi:hypothetical protein